MTPCCIGYMAEMFRQGYGDRTKYLSKVLFFLEDITVMINNFHSALSDVYVKANVYNKAKRKELNNKYFEINLYVRSESEHELVIVTIFLFWQKLGLFFVKYLRFFVVLDKKQFC
jgi:hypothetical protein